MPPIFIVPPISNVSTQSLRLVLLLFSPDFYCGHVLYCAHTISLFGDPAPSPRFSLCPRFLSCILNSFAWCACPLPPILVVAPIFIVRTQLLRLIHLPLAPDFYCVPDFHCAHTIPLFGARAPCPRFLLWPRFFIVRTQFLVWYACFLPPVFIIGHYSLF